MTITWQFFHRVSPRVSWLDHRLVPEVRAMLAAMMSRVPKGGIEARYKEVVEAVAADLWGDELRETLTWEQVVSFGNQFHYNVTMHRAEDRLCSYPLHPKVEVFFQKFVKDYGHSSILELVGSPTVIVEGISPWFAYLTFDNPQVRGQEMSTRAVWRKDWQMATDAGATKAGMWACHQRLVEIHTLGLQIAAAELEAQQEDLMRPCEACDGTGKRLRWSATEQQRQSTHPANPFLEVKSPEIRTEHVDCEKCEGTGRKHPWMKDPQPFRPAFDRARWALPGTIETGVAHCADLRTMARVIEIMENLAIASTHETAFGILQEMKEAYRQALPGMAGMGLREAVYNPEEATQGGQSREDAWEALPGHLRVGFVTDTREDVHVVTDHGGKFGRLMKVLPSPRRKRKSYVDPSFNHAATVDVRLGCSWACTRDWHRHRTFYPWTIRIATDFVDPKFDENNLPEGVRVWGDILVLRGPNGEALGMPKPGKKRKIKLDHHYKAISTFGKENVDRYLQLCTDGFEHFLGEGNVWMAMLCVPLGARMLISGQGGLRDAIYMSELRGYAAGVNYEYQEHAQEILRKIEESTEDRLELREALGFDQPIS